MTKRYPITVWGDQNEKLRSQYGCVSFLRWCELEVERMSKLGAKVKLAFRDGLVAVVYQ